MMQTTRKTRAYKKRPTTKYGKRSYKTWKPTIQFSANVSQRQIVKMNYGDTIQLSGPGPGLCSTYVFRTNSIQDPDFTGIGHQPMSHDQWAGFYNHYAVISSRIRVDFLPFNIGTSASFLGAIRISGESAESKLSSTQALENRQIKSGLCIANGAPLRLYNTYDAFKQFGIKAQLGNTLSSQFGSNPVEDCFFHVSAVPNDVTTTALCTFIVLIEYTVLLMEPRTLSAS